MSESAAEGSEPDEHHTTQSLTGATRFKNPWPSSLMRTWDNFTAYFDAIFRLDYLPCFRKSVPKDEMMVHTDLRHLKNPPSEGIQITWVGHSTFLIQFDGLSMLTDPIFSKRCSPVGFTGPKRYIPAPFDVEDLPPIDVLIVSHNHYDHLDENSVRDLRPLVKHWLVPLGIKKWLVETEIEESRVTELDWWNEKEITLPSDHSRAEGSQQSQPAKTFRFVCTPAQHFSGRSLADKGDTLWGSWAIIGPTKRVYFAGDTGYKPVPDGVDLEEERQTDLPECPIFKEIGDKFGPFDLACLPIGAYSPRAVHCSPEDALLIHRDIRSKQSIAMHWGTFVLADVPILEPPKRLAAEKKRLNIPDDEFITMKQGEIRVYT